MEIDKKLESEGDITLIYNYLKCPCCDNFFNDKLRAFLLRCGHNICNKCLEVNKSTYSCLICLNNYKEEELKSLSVNFLLDEMIQKLINNNVIDSKSIVINDTYHFYCVNCKTLMFSSTFHSKLHPQHKIIDYDSFKNSQVKFYEKLKNDFMSDYHRRITSVQNNMSAFTGLLSEQLTHSLEEQLAILKQDNADNLEALKVIDLISEEEYTKLKQFKQSFIQSEEKTNKLLSQLDQGNITREAKSDLEKLFKNVLDIEQIFNSKLSNIDVKLNEINNNLNDIDPNKFSDDLAYEISNNLKNLIYSETNRNRSNTVLSYFKENVLYLFDTILMDNLSITFEKESMTKVFEVSDSNANLIDELINLVGFSVTTDELDGIFITGGKTKDNIFSDKTFLIKKTDSEKFSIESYPNMCRPRCGHIAVYHDFKLFVIGGEKEEEENASVEYYDIISGYWLEIPGIPTKYNCQSSRIIIVNSILYYLQGLRNLYSLELIKSDNNSIKDINWTEHKIFYDNSYNLNLRNFAFIGNYSKKHTESETNFFIIGGETDEKTNSIIFSLNIDDKALLKKETELVGFGFRFGNQSSNNFSQENDYSYLLGEDKENVVSVFKVYERLDIEEVSVFNKN